MGGNQADNRRAVEIDSGKAGTTYAVETYEVLPVQTRRPRV